MKIIAEEWYKYSVEKEEKERETERRALLTITNLISWILIT